MKRIDKKVLLKSVVRTAVDGCFLPGTMMGTELMVLWVTTRKRELSTVSLALISILFSSFDFASSTSSMSSQTPTDQQS
ncbi:MAG TPA: hypothetical protein VGD65_19690 [Chryseosolibacter sp.]